MEPYVQVNQLIVAGQSYRVRPAPTTKRQDFSEIFYSIFPN